MTQKKTENAVTKTESQSIINPYASEENRKLAQQLFNLFNPKNVQNIESANSYFASVEAGDNRFKLGSYRVLKFVKDNDLWQDDSYINYEGNRRKYANFLEWCKLARGMERQTAYNALKVAEYINEDGTGTTLPHQGERDFNYTQLVRLIESPIFFTKNKGGERIPIMENESITRLEYVCEKGELIPATKKEFERQINALKTKYGIGIKNEPENEPKNEPENEPKNEPKNETENEPKNEPKNETENEPKKITIPTDMARHIAILLESIDSITAHDYAKTLHRLIND